MLTAGANGLPKNRQPRFVITHIIDFVWVKMEFCYETENFYCDSIVVGCFFGGLSQNLSHVGCFNSFRLFE
uniref:Uncharacterized protein n=1 Tax=Vibrio vulnificus TaxID=672 RepID=A0A9P1NFY0_VIBVL|nr:hypothetical protein [Vibrio vulnificus]CAL25438.1 hypothetical protein [Vibrio vulnificus]CAL25507.1 hypothetical protein [Vibrio vulnificus]